MVDYNEIRSGRRREWWKRREEEKERARKGLAPSEEMKRLIREAEEEPPPRKRTKHRRDEDELPPEDFGLPGPPPDPTLLDEQVEKKKGPSRPPARSRFEFNRREDRAEWEKTKRQLVVLGLIAAAALLIFFVLGVIWRGMAAGREKHEMAKYMQKAAKGQHIDDLSDPIRALATYRSAWIRGDMLLVWKITTPAIKKDILAVRSERQHITDQLNLYQNGGYSEWIAVIKGLNEPVYLRHPTHPYRNGELAAFLTQPYAPPRAHRKPTRYVVSFVYTDGDWDFFEGVPESAWNPSWSTIYQAKPGASIE